MPTLFVIPARGGSKGIPGKNIKPLAGKPLLYYTLDVAHAVVNPGDAICLSTDDAAIIAAAQAYGLHVPFVRPAALSTDTAGMNEVLLHALQHYQQAGMEVEKIVLLQPTSPFRTVSQLQEALKDYTPELDMLVSVKLTDANPYYVLAEENEQGYLEKSKKGTFVRRQDCPPVYQYNGAIYIINPHALRQKGLAKFTKVKKYLMDAQSSLDLDTPLDWAFAEFLIQQV